MSSYNVKDLEIIYRVSEINKQAENIQTIIHGLQEDILDLDISEVNDDVHKLDTLLDLVYYFTDDIIYKIDNKKLFCKVLDYLDRENLKKKRQRKKT